MRGVTVWFTGLPGAGKTTIAKGVEARLRSMGVPTEHLDGDVLRQTLTRDLGFSREDRAENIARASFVAKLLTRNGIVVLASFVSPYESMRVRARQEIGEFLLVYVKASFASLLARDVKGLYRKARAGEVRNVTGIDDPFEEPNHPDLVLDTDELCVAECAEAVLHLLRMRGYLPQASAALFPFVREAPKSPDPSEQEPIPPHGGRLVERILEGDAQEALLERAPSLPTLRLDGCRAADLELIAEGALSPLSGFMGKTAYTLVLEHMRLPDGIVWPLPITLPVGEEALERLREGAKALLVDAADRPLGVMVVEEVYAYDKEREARLVFGTTDPAHPGVAQLYRQPPYLVGGPVWALSGKPRPFQELCLTPRTTRRIFAQRGWRRIVAFQTRNPIHRAHEYIQKCAMEIVDGLLLHPLVGETKPDDVPAEVRLRSYQAVLEAYYPRERVLLAVFPAAMRYAGPREALFHALCRKNYGCTHFIVGRDHAGVGGFYDPYAAHRIFDRFRPEEIGITPLFFEDAFFCRACDSMATTKTCPHGEEARVRLSGTKVRAFLQEGTPPPPECTRSEVAAILLASWSP